MSEIRKPAVRIRQCNRTLYFTAFTARDFIEREYFYSVDRLDVDSETGMQRLLNVKRAKALSRDLRDAKRDAALPTSIFLATAGDIQFDETSKQIVFDPTAAAGVCPFNTVDGQHRIEGLRDAVDAAKGISELLDFPIPAVVAPNMDELQQMLQFIIVNTKQQKISAGVAQHIIARFTKMYGVEDLPHIPQWLKSKIEAGDDDRALTIIKRLHADEDSPWRGLIQLADDDRPAGNFAVKQHTLAAAMKRHLLTHNHMLGQITPDREKQIAILKNYWSTVRELFIANNDPRKSVVFKSIGLKFFLPILGSMLRLLARRGNSYTAAAFKQCFVDVGGQLSGAEILEPRFWVSGGVASDQTSAMAEYVKLFNAAVRRVVEDGEQN